MSRTVQTAATSAKTAISYIRVSTREQAERNGSPEGYSIPAQAEACRRKARLPLSASP